MIEIFRKNLFLNSLLLLPYTALIRISSIIEPQAYVYKEYDSSLSLLFYQIFENKPLLQSIFAILLIFFQAVLINRLVIKSRITRELTLFPGLFYIISCSIFPDFLVLSPVLIANTFLIFGIQNIFAVYKKPRASTYLFSAGFWFSLASLFYFPFAAFIIVGYIGIFILRSFKIKERFQYLISLFVPFFWFLTYHLLKGTISSFWDELGNNFHLNNIFSNLNTASIVIYSFLALSLLIFVLSYNQFTIKKSIQVQKKIDILYWILLASIPGLFLFQGVELDHLIIFGIPFSITVGMLFLRLKNALYGELIHLLLLIFIFAMHFNLLII